MLLGGGGGVVKHVSASVLRDLRSPDLAWIGPVREFRQRILALLPADQVPAAKGLHIAALPIGRKRPVRSRLGHDHGIREVSVYTGFWKPPAGPEPVELDGLFEGAAGEVPLVVGPALQATRTAKAPTTATVDHRRSGLMTWSCTAGRKRRPRSLSP